MKWGKGRGEGKGKEGEGRKSQELDGNSMMVKDPGFKKARESQLQIPVPWGSQIELPSGPCSPVS